jgi:hypothetical protein
MTEKASRSARVQEGRQNPSFGSVVPAVLNKCEVRQRAGGGPNLILQQYSAPRGSRDPGWFPRSFRLGARLLSNDRSIRAERFVEERPRAAKNRGLCAPECLITNEWCAGGFGNALSSFCCSPVVGNTVEGAIK